MGWVVFDRAAKQLQEQGLGGEARRWRKIADEIHAEICERGFDRDLNSFVQAYGSKRLDASLLQLALVGFLPANDPRIKGTLQAMRKSF
jgi:GH15 family glucan-1,4-alpha-glucosidase